jgi:hypothetical protein
MDSNKIDELLNKYWNCESSLEEEQQLKEYFRGREIPEQWKETAALFRYFEENKKKTLSDVSFDHQVMEKVKSPEKGKVVKLVQNSLRIAAGIAVLMIAIWFVRNEIRTNTIAQNSNQVKDTYDDPKMALEETKKAFLMISKSFGTAEEQAKKINMFNEAQEEIQKGSSDSSNL